MMDMMDDSMMMGHGAMDDDMMHTGGDDHGNMMMDMMNSTMEGHNHAAGPSDGFCTGNMGMVMFMEGFHWALKGGHNCINLYFRDWTLDSVGKVWAAIVGVAVLAILTEGISKLRHLLSRKRRRAESTLKIRRIALLQTGLHGIHALTGYILMLATMTFSIELLLSVIGGLMVGYVMFGGDTYRHVTTNPCCAFLEDEAIERKGTPSESSSQIGGGEVLDLSTNDDSSKNGAESEATRPSCCEEGFGHV